MARKDRKDLKHSGVTTVTIDKNTTTGKNFPLRLTEHEREELEMLTEKVQALMPNKKISRSRVMRALVYIQDNSQLEKIAESIKDNT